MKRFMPRFEGCSASVPGPCTAWRSEERSAIPPNANLPVNKTPQVEREDKGGLERPVVMVGDTNTTCIIPSDGNLENHMYFGELLFTVP